MVPLQKIPKTASAESLSDSPGPNRYPLLVSPPDMMGLMGMAQVIATIAYGIRGLRRGETTWGWSDFDADPAQENLAQLSRWSLNSAPAWEFPPLAIANQYHDQEADEVKRARYRLILGAGV